MKLVRAADAQAYVAAGHAGVSAFRLQGPEASQAGDFWIGLSVYEAGGIAERGMGDTVKAYVVLEGELTVTGGDGMKHILRRHDSCLIEPFEMREVVNASGAPAILLVIASRHRRPAADTG
ncbi:cupin domain-containing protein [Niveispirillum sp. KHB5.9]|uniref:cupin domain-containing protein n=1 Tax=Niveispirillum sp. KHB5.9 TaxID=3400269 RepID=UPI003A8A8FB0